MTYNHETAVASYAPHDCFEWNVQHYHSGPDYHYSTCGVCGRITGFRWKRVWHRFRSLFTAKQIKPLSDSWTETLGDA